MISSMALTVRRVLLVLFLSAIVVATETRASSAFLIAPSSLSKARQLPPPPPIDRTDGNRGVVGRKTTSTTFEGDRTTACALVIRGGAKQQEEEEEEEEEPPQPLIDCGGSVSGLFGNLRIPASLVAGASLGSAFALPMLNSDGAKIGMAKRLYAFSMVTTLGSMLLVVIISTIAMNDIAIRPKRLSKSVGDYIEENYDLEWMMVRSHFFYGSFAFLGASAFRAYVEIACPAIGKGVLGILASLSMICMSYFIEKTSTQTATGSHPKRLGRFLKAIGTKAKGNALFGAGVLSWLTAVAYLIYIIPHMVAYLNS